MLSRNGHTNDGKFDWTDALVDACISAGITLCTTGLAMVNTGAIYTPEGQLTLLFAVFGQFFAWLGLKRKLTKKEN